jgi:DNA-binding NarL/FixJ family response regulator
LRPSPKAGAPRRSELALTNDSNRAAPQPQPGASHAIRVICVDDHSVLIEGLRAQFAIEGRIEIVAKFATAGPLLEAVGRLKPHAVLLDIEMPGPDVFEVSSRLKQHHPAVHTIMLSAHIRDSYITAAFSAGASAYFAKSDDLEDIVPGIIEVVKSGQGAFAMSPKVLERCRPPATANAAALARATDGLKPTPRLSDPGMPTTLLSTLTARETEVLRLIGKSLSRTQIAAELCRSVKTIDGHQDRMMKKLSITARADLMRFAIREGLAEA